MIGHLLRERDELAEASRRLAAACSSELEAMDQQCEQLHSQLMALTATASCQGGTGAAGAAEAQQTASSADQQQQCLQPPQQPQETRGPASNQGSANAAATGTTSAKPSAAWLGGTPATQPMSPACAAAQAISRMTLGFSESRPGTQVVSGSGMLASQQLQVRPGNSAGVAAALMAALGPRQ